MVGRVTAASLNNLSGMAVSSRNAGVLYVHNDMTRQESFAVSEAGGLLGERAPPGTSPRRSEVPQRRQGALVIGRQRRFEL